MNWQSYPMVRLTVPFILGMVTANFCIRIIPFSLSVLLTILCALLVILFLVRTTPPQVLPNRKFGLVAMLFAFFFGMTLFVRSYHHVQWNVPPDTNAMLQGIVLDSPQKKAKTWGVKVRLRNGRCLLAHVARDSTSSAPCGFDVGDSICFNARHLQTTALHHATASSLCPADSLSRADSVFSQYRKYLFYSGISATCYVPRKAYAVAHADSTRLNPMAFIRSIQHKVVAAYADAGMEGDAAAIVESMTSGDKTGLSRALKESYSRSGVSHVLALSGFHLSVIYTFLEILLLGRIARNRFRNVARVGIILCLWAFTAIAGMPPSLVRAALMCSLMILASVFGRRPLSVNSCAFAALVMLVCNPLVLFNLGFQLSFVSMVGICVCGIPLCRLCPSRNVVLQYVWGMMAISLVCTLFTAPVVGFCFHRLPTFSLFSNIAVSVLASLILYVAALWWMLCWHGGVRAVLTDVLQWLAQRMNDIVRWVSSSKYAVIEWQPSMAEVIASYVVIVFLLLFLQRKSSRSLIGLLAAVVLFCLLMILRKTGCFATLGIA